jgi:hypothetical protein
MTLFNWAKFATLARRPCGHGNCRITTTSLKLCVSRNLLPALSNARSRTDGRLSSRCKINILSRMIVRKLHSTIKSLTLYRYREEEREVNKYCEFAGIGLIPWGPLNAGQLARPLGAQDTTRSESGKQIGWVKDPTAWEAEIVSRVEKTSKDKGWKMSQVALAWINDKVTSPIVGFSSVRSCYLPIYGCALTLHLRPSDWKKLSSPALSSQRKKSSSWKSRMFVGNIGKQTKLKVFFVQIPASKHQRSHMMR